MKISKFSGFCKVVLLPTKSSAVLYSQRYRRWCDSYWWGRVRC